MLVHAALAGLIAAGLLGRRLDWRALLVVFGVVAFLDLDAFVALVIPNTHRAAFHTLLVPLAGAVLLAVDARREDPWLRGRFGRQGVHVAWTAVVVYVVAGIGPDLFTGGANVFYPVYDQFYALDGRIELSTRNGLVQTFVDLSPDPSAGGGDGGGAASGSSVAVGSTDEVHVSSGVDPREGPEPAGVDRVFPLVRSGLQLLLVLTSAVVVGARLWLNARVDVDA